MADRDPASTGTPFAFGRDADVYALGNDRVLRRYRHGGDVSAEAAFMRHVAGHGFPVPEVFVAEGPDLVMQRLDGPTLLEAGVAGHRSPEDVGRMLAGLHERLHRIPSLGGSDAFVVLHGDLHPDNIVMTADGPFVIDWRNATDGPAEFDVAMTAVILAQVAVDPTHADYADMARRALTAFLATSPDPSSQLEAALTRRASDPALTDSDPAVFHDLEAFVRAALSSRWI